MTSSATLFERAQKTIPGGVNSPVRAFRAVGGTPRFIASADGAYLVDAEGQRYIDYVGSWGPMITGHQDPDVFGAIARQLHVGVSYGAPTELALEMDELLLAGVTGLDLVRQIGRGKVFTSITNAQIVCIFLVYTKK